MNWWATTQLLKYSLAGRFDPEVFFNCSQVRQRPPVWNLLLVSIINSCVVAHQFAISISSSMYEHLQHHRHTLWYAGSHRAAAQTMSGPNTHHQSPCTSLSWLRLSLALPCWAWRGWRRLASRGTGRAVSASLVGLSSPHPPAPSMFLALLQLSRSSPFEHLQPRGGSWLERGTTSGWGYAQVRGWSCYSAPA